MEGYINKETLVKNEISQLFETSVICFLCKNILIKPFMCMKCQNNYCKKCIDNWREKNENCPNGCDSPSYKDSLAKKDILSKLKFNCLKCGEEIPYDDSENHHNSCSGQKSSKNTNITKMIKLTPEESSKLKKKGAEMEYITGK